MNHKTTQLFTLLLVLLIATTACRLGRLLRGQDEQPVPTQPVAVEPSATLTPISAEPTAIPAPAEPLPTSAPVIRPTDTPEPVPTNTPEPAPTDTPAPEPTPTAEPAPTEPPAEVETSGTEINWGDAAGKPNFAPGQDVGYFVWVNGNRVHIRVVTRGGIRTFSGRAIGNGALLEVNRVAQEAMDITIREDINQMDFSWVTAGGPDGLDFTFTGTALRLHLRIDNNPAPAFVFVGAAKRTLDNGLPLRLVR